MFVHEKSETCIFMVSITLLVSENKKRVKDKRADDLKLNVLDTLSRITR